jgi:hypothetical protein
MLFLFFMVIALGFFPKQNLRYWLFAVGAIAAQLLAHILFFVDLYGGWSDGFITSFVRHTQKNDFNIFGLFLLEMIFGWGLPLYLIYKGYKRKEKAIESLVKTE